ncbi:hypothetical protein Tco_0583753 [Tanacetum coccineum]
MAAWKTHITSKLKETTTCDGFEDRFLALKRRFKLKKRDAAYTKRASSRYEILGCGDISTQSQYLQYKRKDTTIDDTNANVPLAIYKSAKVLDSENLLNIKFSGLAYVNEIEVVSTPDMLIEDVSDALFPVGKKEYLKNKETVKRLRVAPTVVKYLEGGSPLIASQTMYASTAKMGSLYTILLNFNITCQFVLDGSHPYLICLHFSDIVSKSMNELYFYMFVGGNITINVVDLSTVTSGLSVSYYRDVFLDVSMNGLGILRVNNSVDSLYGEFGAAGRSAEPSRGTVAAVMFAMMFAAFVGLGAMIVKLQKRPQPNLIGLLAKGSLECRSW